MSDQIPRLDYATPARRKSRWGQKSMAAIDFVGLISSVGADICLCVLGIIIYKDLDRSYEFSIGKDILSVSIFAGTVGLIVAILIAWRRPEGRLENITIAAAVVYWLTVLTALIVASR